VNTVFNAAAVRLPSGETLLLCRVEDCSGSSHLCVARSEDGVTDWKIDPEPTLLPDIENHPEEQWGIEDPRVVYLPELKKYSVAYTCYSQPGPGVSLALTEDFRTFDRIGCVMTPEDKDAALFPCRFDGRWAMLHRPMSAAQKGNIWISFSPDLRHWGDHALLLAAKRGPWWDARKIGLSPPVIETKEGWLMLYHGVRETPAGSIYRVGLALLDLKDPRKVLHRGTKWILGPEDEYERTGDVPDAVFPCGYTIDDDGDTLNLYYGGADTCIALARGSINGMLEWLKANSSPGGLPASALLPRG
jgi:predicted GH43/DUF377 family glycosyl hydrolase